MATLSVMKPSARRAMRRENGRMASTPPYRNSFVMKQQCNRRNRHTSNYNRMNYNWTDYNRSTMAEANSEHFTSVAPSMRRAKS